VRGRVGEDARVIGRPDEHFAGCGQHRHGYRHQREGDAGAPSAECGGLLIGVLAGKGISGMKGVKVKGDAGNVEKNN
jgi:hypothetical protein